MNKTFAKIMAAGTLAAMLTTAMPMTSIAAEAATVSTTAKQSQTKKMYVTKTCYSYKSNSTKSAKVKKLSKGAAISVVSEKKNFYKLADGSYVLKSRVGEKRINWTVTKYKTPITRYVLKDNTKVRSSALSNGKIVDFASKGVKLTIVGKTNSGFYQLEDGNFIKTSSVTKTKPVSSDNYYDDFEDKSDFIVSVRMPYDVSISDTADATFSSRDFNFELSVGGETYEGDISADGSYLTIKFEDLGLTPKQLNGAKLKFDNKFDVRVIEGESWCPVFAESGTNTMTIAQDKIYEESHLVSVPMSDVPAELLEELKASPDFDATKATVLISSATCKRYNITVDGDTANYCLSTRVKSDPDTGIGSGTIMDIDTSVCAKNSDIDIIMNKDEYLNSEWARRIGDIFVYCDGELVCHTYPDAEGVFYYTLPIKKASADEDSETMIPAGDITFGVIAYQESGYSVREITGNTRSNFHYSYPSNESGFLLILGRDFVLNYEGAED